MGTGPIKATQRELKRKKVHPPKCVVRIIELRPDDKAKIYLRCPEHGLSGERDRIILNGITGVEYEKGGFSINPLAEATGVGFGSGIGSIHFPHLSDSVTCTREWHKLKCKLHRSRKK